MMCSRYSVFCFILQIAASLGNHYLHLHAPSKSHLCNAPFKRHDEAFNNSTCAKSPTLWDVPAATWCSPVGWSMISWPNCTRRGTAATPTWRQTDIKTSSPTLPFSGSGSGMMCSRYSVFCFILQIAASLGNHYLHLHAPSKSHLCNAPFKRHDEAFNNSTCAKSSTLWDVPAATWCSPVGWSMISWPNCTRRGTAATPTWRQTDIKASSPTLPFSGSGSGMMCSRYSVFCFILPDSSPDVVCDITDACQSACTGELTPNSQVAYCLYRAATCDIGSTYFMYVASVTVRYVVYVSALHLEGQTMEGVGDCTFAFPDLPSLNRASSPTGSDTAASIARIAAHGLAGGLASPRACVTPSALTRKRVLFSLLPRMSGLPGGDVVNTCQPGVLQTGGDRD
ncbi:hypothetical protein MRX96_049827 [Rhipicephalus microplus]